MNKSVLFLLSGSRSSFHLPQRSCSLSSSYILAALGLSYVNVKQGHTDNGHVCSVAQRIKASVSPAVFPLKILTCLSVPKTQSIVDPQGPDPYTFVSILMMFANGIACPLMEVWEWISRWLSALSTKSGIAAGKSCSSTPET